MRTITLIYDGTFNTYRWLKTMMWANKEFRLRGYKIKYASILDYIPCPKPTKIPFEKVRLKWETASRFDIVFLAFHHSQSFIGESAEARINLVRRIKNRANLVCWMDTADSTGTCLFDVLPYVDLYFKKQLLKDKEQYTKEFYCGRPYSDYYHKTLNIRDDKLNSVHYPIADKKYLHKLRVSWNIAFYDRIGGKTWIYKHPFKLSDPLISNMDFEKSIDVHYGGSNPIIYGDVVGYQRKKMLELITDLTDVTHPDVYKKISREEYFEELKHSKSIASPFGWGECCLRDFEAFYNKAILLKPSMEHCITYPNLYQAYKTYLPINWDFSNFHQMLIDIKNGKYDYIAELGQKEYIRYRIGDGAKSEFVTHMISQLGL